MAGVAAWGRAFDQPHLEAARDRRARRAGCPASSDPAEFALGEDAWQPSVDFRESLRGGPEAQPKLVDRFEEHPNVGHHPAEMRQLRAKFEEGARRAEEARQPGVTMRL